MRVLFLLYYVNELVQKENASRNQERQQKASGLLRVERQALYLNHSSTADL